MTTYYPIAYSVPQYVDANGDPYSGAVLKAYSAGTSTNISFATSSTGATTVASIALNAAGYPEVSGNIVVPYLAEDYKLSLYPTQAAADANTGAIWTVDGFPLSGNANSVRYIGYAADTGSANAYAIAPAPAISAYTAGQVVTLIPTNTNTAASTISVSGLPAKAIKNNLGNDVIAGQLSTAGTYQLTYNGTYFVLNQVVSQNAEAGLSSSVNWNTGVLTPGNYLTSGTSYAGTIPLGTGVEHTGALEVMGAGNDLYQVWYNGLVSQRWERMTTDGGSNWTAWRERANTLTYSTVSTDSTITVADFGILKNLTGNTNRTWTLPSAATVGTNWFIIVKNSANATLTLTRAGSDTIDSGTSITIGPGVTRVIYCTGSTAFTSILTSGPVKQFTSTTYAANADLATALPIDDTIPDVTEGAEFISKSVTPPVGGATYFIYLTGSLSAASAVQGIAVYADSTCLSAQSVSATGATACNAFALSIIATVAGSSAVVFSARVGNAAGNAVRMNGTGSARHFGSVQKVTMTIIGFETGA